MILITIVLGTSYYLMFLDKYEIVCFSLLGCFPVLIFGAPYQYVVLPTLSLFASLTPLYFTKESTYKSWKKFAIIALPLMILWTMSGTDSHSTFNILDDKESIAQTSAFFFVLISYILIIVKTFRGKKE